MSAIARFLGRHRGLDTWIGMRLTAVFERELRRQHEKGHAS